MPQSAGGRGKDYRESDFTAMFERGPEWSRWSDAVDWLRNWGARDDRMRSADTRRLLIRDLRRLEDEGVPFTRTPGDAYKLARGHRRPHEGIENA